VKLSRRDEFHAALNELYRRFPNIPQPKQVTIRVRRAKKDGAATSAQAADDDDDDDDDGTGSEDGGKCGAGGDSDSSTGNGSGSSTGNGSGSAGNGSGSSAGKGTGSAGKNPAAPTRKSPFELERGLAAEATARLPRCLRPGFTRSCRGSSLPGHGDAVTCAAALESDG
jgi:hypothetical protein